MEGVQQRSMGAQAILFKVTMLILIATNLHPVNFLLFIIMRSVFLLFFFIQPEFFISDIK
jgi:hypothetical protein